MRTPSPSAKPISYSSRPGPIEDFVKQHNVRYAGWDFDGTIADTERLHRAICRAALTELGRGQLISDRAWNSDLFRSAFNLPADETNHKLASGLREYSENMFQSALAASLRSVVPFRGDAAETVARAISAKRDELARFYQTNVSLTSDPEPGVKSRLEIPGTVTAENASEAQRLNLLRPVKVEMYSYVRETIDSLAAMGIQQGVCTSSARSFVEPLLDKFGILRKFVGLVFAGCVPAGHHKPEPLPWRLLKARIVTGNANSQTLPHTDDMIHFENSAGGALSALRAGRGPTIVKAENDASILGKIQSKLSQHGPENVLGKALVGPCLSRFHREF